MDIGKTPRQQLGGGGGGDLILADLALNIQKKCT